MRFYADEEEFFRRDLDENGIKVLRACVGGCLSQDLRLIPKQARVGEWIGIFEMFGWIVRFGHHEGRIFQTTKRGLEALKRYERERRWV
jgi:hypothetical protein